MKRIEFEAEARKGLLAGVTKLFKAVGSTLGARGKHVIFNMGSQIAVTKDGVTVANQFSLEDPIEDAGAKLVREAAARTARDAGDGTTTSTVIAYSLITEAMSEIDNDVSAIDIKRGMEEAKNMVLAEIESMKRDVVSKEDTFNVAKISGNNDAWIGKVISEIYDKVGKSGVVRLEETQMNQTTFDVVSGCQIESGFINRNFITDKSKGISELKEPLVFVTDKKFEGGIEEIKPVLEEAMMEKRPIVIFCSDMEGEVLGTLMMNKSRGVIDINVVKSNEYDRNVMQQILEDIAIITGATFVSEDRGVHIKDFTFEMFGEASAIISNDDTTTIIGRKGDQELIDLRVEEIKTEIENDKSKHYTFRLNRRIATLTGGVGVIFVGGNSPSETKEMYYRLEDALAATKAALEEGIVPGGGIAYLRAADKLKSYNTSKRSYQLGFDLFLSAMEYPIMSILLNSSDDVDDAKTILNKILSAEYNVGYDVLNDEYVDMFEAGIVDPLKVVKAAITNATSVASLIITTDCVIVDDVRKK